VATNVPQPVFTPTGLQIPSAAAVLAGVQADINAAFGGNLNFTSPATPQNQLAVSIAAIINNTYASFLSLTNQFDPQYAFGRYQDALGEIYGLQRDPAESTVVQATCSGLTGTIIPIGALAQDNAGNLYSCTQAGTIPIGGSVVLEFAANIPGPTPCPANALNTIYQAIPGWDSVINLADGVIGQNTETRAQFEASRQATLQANGQSVLASIRGAVLEVSGVLDCYTAENDTGSPIVIGGQTLVANSVYVAVEGGAAADVAKAIFTKKPPGCAMNGNTTIAVQDNQPPLVPPYPTYNITFEIPNALPILFSVALANGPNVPSNVTQLVQQAIVNVFSGIGGTRPTIGSTIYATDFVPSVAALGSWVKINSLLIDSPNTPDAQCTGSIGGTTLTVSAAISGVLAVGQILTDAAGNIAPGTVVVSFGSDNPMTGTGTVNISPSQTVASETITGTLPDGNSVLVNINQTPTINASNILVSLV